jgi:arsenite-transporting ATPase
MRVILFTGKGGVGKTTVAAATALQIAASGKKTLVMSTDPAHSLADSLGVEVGPDPLEVAPNLWAEQLDPQQRLEENWRDIQQHAIALLDWAGLAEVEAEELSVIPGLDELFSLADVKRHHDHDPYDVLVVDCAPTGETLRLLSLPDIIQWYMERIFPVERRLMGALRPIARRFTDLPLPDSNVYGAVERFYDKLDGVKVVNPEKMVIAEARRTFTYLSLFGYRVDAVVANRLLPEEVTDPYFTRWKNAQADHMATIEESFSPTPILRASLRDREVTGEALLAELGGELYGSADPSSVLFTQDPMTISKRGEDRILSLRLPFADRSEVDVAVKRDELFVKVGPYRRTVVLPKALVSRRIGGATLRDERLEIVFEQKRTAADG